MIIFTLLFLAGVVGQLGGRIDGSPPLENGTSLKLLSQANEAVREANFGTASRLLDLFMKDIASKPASSSNIASGAGISPTYSSSSSFISKDCLQARWLIASRVLAASYHSVVADLSPLLIERNFEAISVLSPSKHCEAELVPLLRLIKFLESNDAKSAEKEWRNNVMMEKTNSTNQSPLEILARAEEKFASAHLKRLAISSPSSTNNTSTITTVKERSDAASVGRSPHANSDDLQKKTHSLVTALRMQKEAREAARLSFALHLNSSSSSSLKEINGTISPIFPAKSSLLARSLYSSAEAFYQLGQIERSAQYFESAARESIGLTHKHPLRATCLSMAALVLEETKFSAASSACVLSSGEQTNSICLEMASVIAAQESLTAYDSALKSWARVPASIRQHNADWAMFAKRATLASARASPSWLKLSQLEASVLNSRIDSTFSSASKWHSSVFSFLPQLTARALGREGGSSSLGLSVLKEALTSLAAVQSAAMPLSLSLPSTLESFSSNLSASTSSTSGASLDFNFTRAFTNFNNIYNNKSFNQSSLYFKMISQLAVLAPASLQAAVNNISVNSKNNNNTNTMASYSLTSCSMALLLIANNVCETERAVDIATIALVRDELIKTGGASSLLSSFSSFSAAAHSSSSSSSTSPSPSSPHFSLDLAKAAAEIAGLVVDPNRHYGKPGQSNAIISADVEVTDTSSSGSFFWPFSSSSSSSSSVPSSSDSTKKKKKATSSSHNAKKQKQTGNIPSHANGKTQQPPVDPGFDRYSFDSFNEDGSGGFYSSEQSLRYAREAHAQAVLEAKAKNPSVASTNAAVVQPAAGSSISQQQQSANHNQALNLAWNPRVPPNHLMVGLESVRTDAIRRISDVFVRCYVAYFACKSKDVKGKTVVTCESQKVPNAPQAFIDIFKTPNGVLDNALGMLTPLGLDYLDLLLYEVLASASAAREKGIAPPEWDFAFQQKGSRAGLPTIVFKK